MLLPSLALITNDLDLVITGSADSTVKVWRLSNGTMLKTLSQYRSAWITQVCLFRWYCDDTCTCCNQAQCHRVCAQTTNNANATNNPSSSSKKCCILSRDNLSLQLWGLDTTNHNVHIEHSEEWDNQQMSILPGLCRKQNSFLVSLYKESQLTIHVYECNLSYRRLKQLRSAGTGDTLLNSMVHIHTCSIHDSCLPQYYLGSGIQWSAFLVAKASGSELYLVQHIPMTLTSSYPIRHELRSSKRGSTFSMCERAWMDGLAGVKHKHPIFVSSLTNNQIYLLKWKLDDA